MVDSSDRDSIKRWLDAIKPAKRRREVAVALAARAALRAVPLLGQELTHGKRSRPTVLSDFVLPSLRATALPWVVGKYPAHSTELHVFAGSAASAALSAAAAAASATGTLFAPFVPSSEGSAGDYLHPNRYGYQIMGDVAFKAVSNLLSRSRAW